MTAPKSAKKRTAKSAARSAQTKRLSGTSAVSTEPEHTAATEATIRRFGPFKMTKYPKRPRIAGALELFIQTSKLIKNNYRYFLIMTLVYAVLTIVFVRGLGSFLDVKEAKNVLGEFMHGSWSNVTITASLFGLLLGTAGSVGTTSGSAYQSLLLILVTLATVWGLRQMWAGRRVTVRQSFYKGLYPFAVFVIVLAIVGLQLVPLGIGTWSYSVLVNGGILFGMGEKLGALLFSGTLTVLSVYMISSSLFALFISTLPNMTPMVALRNARQLVGGRRLSIMARIASLIIVTPIVSALIILPFIVVVPAMAEWIFFVVTMFGTIAVVVYMYLLYRELLNE